MRASDPARWTRAQRERHARLLRDLLAIRSNLKSGTYGVAMFCDAVDAWAERASRAGFSARYDFPAAPLGDAQ